MVVICDLIPNYPPIDQKPMVENATLCLVTRGPDVL